MRVTLSKARPDLSDRMIAFFVSALAALAIAAATVFVNAAPAQAHGAPHGNVYQTCDVGVGGTLYHFGYTGRVTARKPVSGGVKVYSAWVNNITREGHAHIIYCWA